MCAVQDWLQDWTASLCPEHCPGNLLCRKPLTLKGCSVQVSLMLPDDFDSPESDGAPERIRGPGPKKELSKLQQDNEKRLSEGKFLYDPKQMEARRSRNSKKMADLQATSGSPASHQSHACSNMRCIVSPAWFASAQGRWQSVTWSEQMPRSVLLSADHMPKCQLEFICICSIGHSCEDVQALASTRRPVIFA